MISHYLEIVTRFFEFYHIRETCFFIISQQKGPVDYFDTFVQEWYAGGGGELTENVRDSYQ